VCAHCRGRKQATKTGRIQAIIVPSNRATHTSTFAVGCAVFRRFCAAATATRETAGANTPHTPLTRQTSAPTPLFQAAFCLASRAWAFAPGGGRGLKASSRPTQAARGGAQAPDTQKGRRLGPHPPHGKARATPPPTPRGSVVRFFLPKTWRNGHRLKARGCALQA
jgi:hypothetical protein